MIAHACVAHRGKLSCCDFFDIEVNRCSTSPNPGQSKEFVMDSVPFCDPSDPNQIAQLGIFSAYQSGLTTADLCRFLNWQSSWCD
jgi:hypothetical protein